MKIKSYLGYKALVDGKLKNPLRYMTEPVHEVEVLGNDDLLKEYDRIQKKQSKLTRVQREYVVQKVQFLNLK